MTRKPGEESLTGRKHLRQERGLVTLRSWRRCMSHARNPPARQRRRPKRTAPRFRMPEPRRPSPPLADALSERVYGLTTIQNAWRREPVCESYGCWCDRPHRPGPTDGTWLQ